MQPLSTRTAHFTDSVIRRMTRISNQYGAVNLSQGFPDFDPPKEIMDALAKAAEGAAKPISDKRGTTEFRIDVAGVLARRAAKIAYDRAKGLKA